LRDVNGKELEGIHYEQLMPYVQPDGKAFVVIIGDFVTTEEGTGIVHTASLFGADDFRVCKANGISSVLVKDENGNTSPLVDKRGRFVKEVTDFAGEFVREEYLTDEEKEIEKKKQKVTQRDKGDNSAEFVNERAEKAAQKEEREKLVKVVFVKNGNKAQMVKVTTGIADDSYMEIKSGIKPGDEVISGSYSAISRKLKEGAKVAYDKEVAK
jgi:co-chaperonin GroES (HSP10)